VWTAVATKPRPKWGKVALRGGKDRSFPFLVAAISLTFMAPARATSLYEALESAYDSSPALMAARAELSRIDEQVPQARAGWRPEATFTGGGGYSDTSSSSSTQTNQTSNSGATAVAQLRVRQPLYRYGVNAGIEQATKMVQAQRARLAATEADVLLQAATAYLNVLHGQAVVDFNTEHQQLMQRSLKTVEHRFALGEVRNSDVAQAKVSFTEAAAQRTRAEADLESAREAFMAAVGDAPESLEMPQLPGNLPATQEEVLVEISRNPNVVAAEYSWEAAQDGVDVSFGQFLPQAYLQGEAQPQSQGIFALVEIPLYRGTTSSQVRAAKDLVRQRGLEAELARRTARQKAVSAWQTLQAAKVNVAAYEAQVKAAAEAVDTVGREEKLGLRTVADVLLAQQQVLDAKVSLITAREDTLTSAFRVLAVMGRLSASDLGLNVQSYDPKQHYREVRGRW